MTLVRAIVGSAVFLVVLGFGVVKPAYASPPPVSSEITVSARITGPTGDLRLVGYTSSASMVTFLKNGSVVGTTLTNSDGLFDKTLMALDPGVYTFSLYATDAEQRSTLTLSFDTNIMSGNTITLSGFLLPPTLAVTKPTLKRPEAQSSLGMAKPNSTVTAFFNSDPISKQVSSNIQGNWEAKVPVVFHLGKHTTSAIVQDGSGNQSILSQSLPFDVILSADLNVDTKVNLTDFSILMFNYARSQPPNPAADINDNGPIDLVDFSVMMFHWTGG